MNVISVPTFYLAIRYIQAPLAALVFVLDIATIALVATNGNYTYGSLGWCAVVVCLVLLLSSSPRMQRLLTSTTQSVATVVVCLVHVIRIRANAGFTNGIFVLIFEVIFKICWLTVWSVMAWSAVNVQDAQYGSNWQGILACTALAAAASAVQW